MLDLTDLILWKLNGAEAPSTDPRDAKFTHTSESHRVFIEPICLGLKINNWIFEWFVNTGPLTPFTSPMIVYSSHEVDCLPYIEAVVLKTKDVDDGLTIAEIGNFVLKNLSINHKPINVVGRLTVWSPMIRVTTVITRIPRHL
jgi:hypothetical protein